MALSLNTRLDRYEIISLLGSGGMGEVYLAEDKKLQRKVALKVLPEDLSTKGDRLRRFEQEARAASALNHPNILTIYEIGECEGLQFIAMELVEGETLREKLQHERLAVDDVLDIAIQTAGAISAAHEANITHRDIKPENIMLRRDRLVKVLDFGLAKLSENPPAVIDTEAATRAQVKTEQGVVMGTVNYMSPEQARGKKTDARTDIWSLGCVMYEMVTLRTPFEGETTADRIASIIHKQPAPLSRFAENIPSRLEEIVEKCLEKNVDDRYQTSKDLLVDLRRLKRRLDFESEIERSNVSTGSAIEAKQISNSTRTVPEAVTNFQSLRTTSSAEYIGNEIKRHKFGAALAIGFIVIAIAGVAFGAYKLINRNSPRRAISFESARLTRLTTSGKVSQAVISPDGKYVVHVVDDAGLQSLRVRQVATSSDVEILAPAPVQLVGLTFTRDGNYVYYILESKDLPERALYQIPTLGGMPRKLLTNLDIDAVTFSPDGSRFAFVRYERGKECALMIANSDGTGEQKLVSHNNPPESISSPAWSPDGKVIAYVALNYNTNDASLLEARTADSQVRTLTSQKWFRVNGVTWLSDGSGMLMLASDRKFSDQVWHLAYPSGEAYRVTNDLNDYDSLSLTGDAKTLALVQAGGQGSLWVAPFNDAARARQITQGSGKWDGYLGIFWSPDGRIVYSPWLRGGGEIWITDVEGKNQRQLAASGDDRNPAVTPDGRYIFFLSDRTGSPHIWRMDIDGGNAKQLTNGLGESRPNCSPDGRWVVYQTTFGKRTIWRVSTEGGEPVQLSDKFSQNPVFSPDGKWIAYIYSDESTYARIEIIPFDGGEPVKTFDVPQTFYRDAGIRWMPDGRAVAYVDTREGVSNVWIQAVGGGAAKKLTDFKSERIFWFEWSRDGKQLALARGSATSDVVLIENFR